MFSPTTGEVAPHGQAGRHEQIRRPTPNATGRTFAPPSCMRAVLLIIALTGCTDSALDQDTTYRRLRDEFQTEDQCLAQGNFTPCYQTLALCADGRSRIDLVNSPQHGTYRLADSTAILSFAVMGTIHFDLDAASSTELPGVHPWEQI